MAEEYTGERFSDWAIENIGPAENLVPEKQPICIQCAHLAPMGNTCLAFPDGIPEVFWSGEQNHLTPVDGDLGITFDLREPSQT